MRQHQVFVYGTLMKHEANHHYLRDAQCLGVAITAPQYRLYSLGPYPVLCLNGKQRIQGEVYRVSQMQMRRLDQLEEYPHYYQRKLIPTPYGQAWIYYHKQTPTNARLIASGNWRDQQGRILQRFNGCLTGDWDSRE